MDVGVQSAYEALFSTPLAAPVIQAIENLAKHVKAAKNKPGKKKPAISEATVVANV